MSVPFIDLSKLAKKIEEPVLAEWKECLSRTEFVGGPRVAAVETRLQSLLGIEHAIACANGTDAIIIALQGYGIGPGKRVALPNLTFWATYEAVAQLGATAVLIDIDPTDLQLDYELTVKAHKAKKLDAILLPHLYGWASARLADFRSFAKSEGLVLIEDGAQCFGVEVNGEPIFKDAEAATLSFYPAKVIGGAMDGGAMLTRSADKAAIIRSLANHGRSAHYSYAHVGWNSRMGGLQAAYLNAMLELTSEIVADRKKTAEKYRAALGGSTFSSKVKVYGPPAGIGENGYLNVLTVAGKGGQEMVDALKAKGIGSARTYPETISSQPPVQNHLGQGLAEVPFEVPVSTDFCGRVLNLPLFYGMSEAQFKEALEAFESIVSA